MDMTQTTMGLGFDRDNIKQGITSGTVTWWKARKVVVAVVYEDDRPDRRIMTRVVFLDDGTEGMPFIDELGYKVSK